MYLRSLPANPLTQYFEFDRDCVQREAGCMATIVWLAAFGTKTAQFPNHQLCDSFMTQQLFSKFCNFITVAKYHGPDSLGGILIFL